jgi:hemolysin III
MEGARLDRFDHPVRGLLNLVAALASIGGVGVLRGKAGPTLEPALWVYGVSLVVMFTVSSVYHSIPWSTRWKERMRRLDHAAIFLFVAGSATPIILVAVDGPWRAATIAWVWSTAAIGIAVKLIEPTIHLKRSVILQNLIGWSVLVPLTLVGRRLDGATIGLILAGGLVHGVGVILFVMRRPVLAPRVFSFHEFFHVLVMTGTAIHFHVIVNHIVPLAT